MMTLKETADAAISHLYKQNRTARERHGCRFKTKDGLKCFVGGLIKDQFYDSCLEDCSLLALFERMDKGREGSGPLHDALVLSDVDISNADVRRFLLMGQLIHDSCHEPRSLDDVKTNYSTLRAKYGI